MITIAKLLTNLEWEGVIFHWTPRCRKSFDKLRELLCTAPELRFRHFKKEFALSADVSSKGLGAVLSQNRHPCLFISRRLNKVDETYGTSEKKFLAVACPVKRLRSSLLWKKFVIKTYYKALNRPHNVKDRSSRLLR